MAKYWTQTQAPSGGWCDTLGSEDKESCIRFAKWLVENNEVKDSKEAVRVVERTDVVVWEGHKI